MKIKEAIQQKKPFRGSRHKAIVNLIFTHNWITDNLRLYLKPYDITLKQYNVLRILKGAGNPISTSDIRERLLDKMSDTSRIVERLYKKGLVKKTTSAADKRLVDVVLSRRGILLLTELEEHTAKMDNLLSILTETEAELLSDLLDKIRGCQVGR